MAEEKLSTKEKDAQKSQIETDETNLTKYWNARNTELLKRRDLVNLVKPEAKTGQSNWTTNEPKVFFDTARSLVSINPPRFRLPILMNYSPEEQQKMNKAERLCIGIYRALNDRQCDIGGVDWMWDLAYWMLLGWYAVFSVVQKDSENQLKFIADIWDPSTVYPQWDTEGLSKCVRTYHVDKVTAIAMASDLMIQQGLGEEEFGEPTSSEGMVKIINWWERSFNNRKKAVIKNAIGVGGQLIKPMTVQSKLKRIPIHIGAIGSPDRTVANWMERKGEAITDADKDMYDYFNAIMRLEAQILAENAYPNRVWKLLNPHAGTPGKAKGYGEDIRIKPQEAVELLRTSTTPQEANTLLEYLGSQIQKGSVPNVVYGSMPMVETSGFAISQLMASIKYKLGMYLNGMQRVSSRVFTDFLYQYRTGKYGKITLSTENPYDTKRGMAYLEEYSHQDIPQNIYVEVTIPISSQFDKTQAIMNSVQALQSGLLSRETLWEEELDIQDAEQEKERIREDQVNNDPFIVDIELIERMWAKVEMYQEKSMPEKADALKRYIMQKEMNLGIRKGIPETAGGTVPPNVMPPEARTTPAVTEDQAKAFMGKPPPSPTTMGQNVGRKGVIVSPSGEPLM